MPVNPFDKNRSKKNELIKLKRRFDSRRERGDQPEDSGRFYKWTLIASLVLLIVTAGGWIFLKLDGVERVKKMFSTDEAPRIVENEIADEPTSESEPASPSKIHVFENTPILCADGQDNDHDNMIDEKDPGCALFVDADGDGYAGLHDCDDFDSEVHPEAAEICDEVDNDCNGSVDEGCACKGKSKRACGSTSTIAKLYKGAQFCRKGKLSVCQFEICGDGLDNNKNGTVDEGCYCVPGAVLSCNTAKLGVCGSGTATCTKDSAWGYCAMDVAPTIEDCGDGHDNDCDGMTDCSDSDCAADKVCIPKSMPKKKFLNS